MKICFTIADLQPENGGPSRSVAALAAAVAGQVAEARVLALEYGGGKAAPMLPPASVKTTLVPCRGALAQKLKWSSGFAQTLGEIQASIIHDNGVWLPTNRIAARVAGAQNLPLVVSPRGMLTPWAMQFRGFKKQLAWQWYQRSILQSARVLHATSVQEAEGFRTLGLSRPIAVIPNGVDLPVLPPESGQRSSERRTILFLSRVHPKKGLLDLVAAWAAVKSDRNRAQAAGSWRVVIVGGDENGHLADVQAESRKRQVEMDFEFVGEVPDDQKWHWYRKSDLFVLPSKSENFGIVIAEALACGVPVITTRGTPWSELTTQRCGWWVEPNAAALAPALAEAIQLSDLERQAMGQRGRQWVEKNYAWTAAAEKMVTVYQWALGAGPKPECVMTS